MTQSHTQTSDWESMSNNQWWYKTQFLLLLSSIIVKYKMLASIKTATEACISAFWLIIADAAVIFDSIFMWLSILQSIVHDFIKREWINSQVR